MSDQPDSLAALQAAVDVIRTDAAAQLAAAPDAAAVESLRLTVLGRSGSLTALLRGLGGLSPEERPAAGAAANAARVALEVGHGRATRRGWAARSSTTGWRQSGPT